MNYLVKIFVNLLVAGFLLAFNFSFISFIVHLVKFRATSKTVYYTDHFAKPEDFPEMPASFDWNTRQVVLNSSCIKEFCNGTI